jgi:hypothetical protein
LAKSSTPVPSSYKHWVIGIGSLAESRQFAPAF